MTGKSKRCCVPEKEKYVNFQRRVEHEKRKNYFHLLLMLTGLLMLLCAGMTVSAAEKSRVRINNVDYVFYKSEEGKKTDVVAYIDDVRGSDLPTELYIPKKIKYKNKKYKVSSFVWGDLEEYKYTTAIGQEYDKPFWRPNVVIPDKNIPIRRA